MQSPASDINSATLLTPSVLVIGIDYPAHSPFNHRNRPIARFPDYYAL
ncbi:hypothetical protein NY08_4771 [Rhodococcus sp. B7740]|nr:hypothetical protein NY08_4771 [Rhodococcus sp. B7740]